MPWLAWPKSDHYVTNLLQRLFHRNSLVGLLNDINSCNVNTWHISKFRVRMSWSGNVVIAQKIWLKRDTFANFSRIFCNLKSLVFQPRVAFSLCWRFLVGSSRRRSAWTNRQTARSGETYRTATDWLTWIADATTPQKSSRKAKIATRGWWCGRVSSLSTMVFRPVFWPYRGSNSTFQMD